MARVLKNNSVTETSAAGTGRALPVIIVLSSLLLVALCVAGYFYYQYRKTPEVANAKEIKELQETVGALILLPPEEEPTLATVTDREKLAEQPFFQKAENGDKVLIYTNSGRAILYRPSLKKIVDVTTVNVNPQTAQNTTATTTPGSPTIPAPTTPSTEAAEGGVTPETLRVALYNGSVKVGMTAVVEQEVLNSYPKATITSKETAGAKYIETMVVDLTGKNPVLAESLSFAVKGKVASLPEGEKPPTDADILVIVGNDK